MPLSKGGAAGGRLVKEMREVLIIYMLSMADRYGKNK